jgi:serine/threonine protein kinase
MLLDFGAARQTINTDLPTLAPMYTPGFAAPELYTKGATLGPWTDIYSIGAAVYACMAGAPPQAADARKAQDEMAARFDKLDGAYSPELLAMVKSCLALDPLARPQSVFALQKALQGPRTAPAPAEADEEAPASGWRSLFGRLRRQN